MTVMKYQSFLVCIWSTLVYFLSWSLFNLFLKFWPRIWSPVICKCCSSMWLTGPSASTVVPFNILRNIDKYGYFINFFGFWGGKGKCYLLYFCLTFLFCCLRRCNFIFLGNLIPSFIYFHVTYSDSLSSVVIVLWQLLKNVACVFGQKIIIKICRFFNAKVTSMVSYIFRQQCLNVTFTQIRHIYNAIRSTCTSEHLHSTDTCPKRTP